MSQPEGGCTDFAAFWPRYMQDHANPANRALHLIGTGLAFALLAAGAFTLDWRLVAAAPVAGYALAWIGHGLVEGNRPATFTHPMWSLAGDIRMFLLFLGGRLSSEVRKHVTPADGQ